MITDVILDSMGVLLGILLIMLSIKIVSKIPRKAKNNKNRQNVTIKL